MHAHIQPLIHTLEQFSIATPPYGMILGGGRKLENLERGGEHEMSRNSSVIQLPENEITGISSIITYAMPFGRLLIHNSNYYT